MLFPIVNTVTDAEKLAVKHFKLGGSEIELFAVPFVYVVVNGNVMNVVDKLTVLGSEDGVEFGHLADGLLIDGFLPLVQDAHAHVLADETATTVTFSQSDIQLKILFTVIDEGVDIPDLRLLSDVFGVL